MRGTSLLPPSESGLAETHSNTFFFVRRFCYCGVRCISNTSLDRRLRARVPFFSVLHLGVFLFQYKTKVPLSFPGALFVFLPFVPYHNQHIHTLSPALQHIHNITFQHCLGLSGWDHHIILGTLATGGASGLFLQSFIHFLLLGAYSIPPSPTTYCHRRSVLYCLVRDHVLSAL